MGEVKGIDRDIAAKTIKAAMALKKVNQKSLGGVIGLHQVFISAFLNRKIDLLPADINKIFSELGINKIAHRLSAPANNLWEE